MYTANNDESRTVAVGAAALYSMDGDVTVTQNTAIGYATGYYISTGVSNTHLG